MSRIFIAGFVGVAALAVAGADYVTQARASGSDLKDYSLASYMDTIAPRLESMKSDTDDSDPVLPETAAVSDPEILPEAPEMTALLEGADGADPEDAESRNLLSSFFGGGDDSDTETAETAEPLPTAQPAKKRNVPKRLSLSEDGCRTVGNSKFCKLNTEN